MDQTQQQYGITEEMIERAGRALCAWENERDYQRSVKGLNGDLGTTGFVGLEYEDWREEYDEQARVALVAALDTRVVLGDREKARADFERKHTR